MISPVLILALSMSALLTFASVRRIPEGQAYILRRWGKPTRTLGAGVHLVLPFMERVARKISLLGRVIDVRGDVERQGMPCAFTGNVYFQVLDAERAESIIEDVEHQLREQLLTLSTLCSLDEDLLSRNLRFKQLLNLTLSDRGILVTRVQLNFD